MNNTNYDESIINDFNDFFQMIATTNFFYSKKVLISDDEDYELAQKIGNLGGIVVNGWDDEKQDCDIFIVRNDDHNSKNYGFVKNLIINQQTKVDIKREYLTSNIIIIKKSSFLFFLQRRNEYKEDRSLFELNRISYLKKGFKVSMFQKIFNK